MRPDNRTVFVAGAGIAGLTLALALAKFGVSVVVLERAEGVQAAGAGLQLSPNARHVLNRLGLDEAIAVASFVPEGIDVWPLGARRPLVTLALGAEADVRYGAPYAVMHRADLAEVLHAACKRFASIDMRFGIGGYEAEPADGRMAVTVDGTTRSAFALVGADGVHSPIRARIGGPAALASGNVAWRCLLPLSAAEGVLATHRTSLLLMPGGHMVSYPLPHRGALNVVAFTPANDEPRRFLRHARAAPLLHAAGDSWTQWPVSTVASPVWHDGAMGLVGDAAHAMLPFQAQGAAMAIEDAAVLAPLLAGEADAATAFARYEALRRPRVEQVARLSARNGFAFHAGWPVSLARDAAIALGGPRGHFRRLDWLYGLRV